MIEQHLHDDMIIIFNTFSTRRLQSVPIISTLNIDINPMIKQHLHDDVIIISFSRRRLQSVPIFSTLSIDISTILKKQLRHLIMTFYRSN